MSEPTSEGNATRLQLGRVAVPLTLAVFTSACGAAPSNESREAGPPPSPAPTPTSPPGQPPVDPPNPGTAGPPPGGSPPNLAPYGCVSSVTPGKHVFRCGVGKSMTFDVTAPNCSTQRCGVIVDMHGSFMDGRTQELNTNLADLGSAAGYIVVQPNGESLTMSTREDPQLVDFLKDIAKSFDADLNRVHMTGFSQGGFLTWRMLCHHSNLFASVAPAGAGLNPVPPEQAPVKLKSPPHCQFSGAELPGRRMPILYMHGVDDAMVEYASGERMVSAIQNAWQLGDPTVIESGHHYERLRYAGTNGGSLDFIRHRYTTDAQVGPLQTLIGTIEVKLKGHCYPGSTHLSKTGNEILAFGCQGQSEFHWGRMVLDFFIANPKR